MKWNVLLYWEPIIYLIITFDSTGSDVLPVLLNICGRAGNAPIWV
jgi:hypothetical protein